MSPLSPSSLLAGACCGLALVLNARPSRLACVGRARDLVRSRGRRLEPLVAGLAAAAALPVVGSAGMLVLSVGAVVLAATRSRRLQSRTKQRTQRCVVGLCADLAAELTAGLPPATALRRVAALDPYAAELLAAVTLVEELGGDVPAAWEAQAATPGAEGLRAVGACWAVTQRTGGSLAAALGRVGATLDERLRRRRDVETRLAGARSTARLLAALPAAGVALGWSVGSDPVGPLLGTGWGRACLLAAAALDVLGMRWAAAISARAAAS